MSIKYILDEHETDQQGRAVFFKTVARGTVVDIVEWGLKQPGINIEDYILKTTHVLEACLKQFKDRLRISFLGEVPWPDRIILHKPNNNYCLILDPPPGPEDEATEDRPVVAPLSSRQWKCDFLSCFHGMGMAGSGICAGHGRWWDKDCPEYKNEDEELRRWERRDILLRRF